MEFRLHLGRLRDGEPGEVVHAVGLGRGLDLLDAGDLVVTGGDDQLTERLMRHAVLATVVVKSVPALDAGGRFEAVLRIVEPAMDHLAVARGGFETDRVSLFETTTS